MNKASFGFLVRALLLSLSPILGAVFVILVILGVVALSASWDSWCYPTTTRFDKRRWASDWKYRYSVVQTVASKVVKKGMTGAQVEQILGKPDTKRQPRSWDGQTRSWEYETSPPGFHFGDFSGTLLHIEFDEKRRVVKAEREDWTD